MRPTTGRPTPAPRGFLQEPSESGSGRREDVSWEGLGASQSRCRTGGVSGRRQGLSGGGWASQSRFGRRGGVGASQSRPRGPAVGARLVLGGFLVWILLVDPLEEDAAVS